MKSIKYRSSSPDVFYKNGDLKNFAIFTGKHLCRSIFFIEKETLTQVFSCIFCEIFLNTFFYITPRLAVSKSTYKSVTQNNIN